MKLAKEMLEWYKKNRKVRRFKITDAMYMKYFKEIEKNLDYDEEVYIAFIGSIGEYGSFFHAFPCFFGELCGIAITNKGITVSKSNGVVFPIKSILTVQLNYFNDVTKVDRIFMSTLILDSIKETITVTLRKKDTQVFYNLIRRMLIDKESIVNNSNFGNGNMNINDANYSKNNEINTEDMNRNINSIEELKRFNTEFNNGWERE